MVWKSENERHSDDVIKAIHDASRRIALSIEKGFALMADAQTQALADLTQSVTTIGDAIAGEIAALQAAVSAAANFQPDDSAAIEAQVTKLNDLAAALKNSVAPPTAPASAPTPSSTPTVTA